MRFESNAREGQESKPTFFGWCKENKDQKTPLKFFVVRVWEPNKFPDITLETEQFRLRVHHKSSLFSAIKDLIDQWSREDVALAITEIDKDEYDYVLEICEGESADWERLGSSGWKVTIKDKPKSTKPRGKGKLA